jgi:cobalt-zinc-cadmium efflux system membrane fusion protein
MRRFFTLFGQVVGLVILVGSVGLVVAVGVGFLPLPWKVAAAGADPAADEHADKKIQLVPGMAHTVAVPEEVRKSLGITRHGVDQIVEAKLPKHSRELVLPGSTALDPSRLFRIRARFGQCRVGQIAPVRDEEASEAAGVTKYRELRPGDQVKKGDLLGVFHSVDVGNKKNDLIDAISQRFLDEEILEKAEKAYRAGALPEIYMLNAQRNVEADRNAERRAVNNLRTWDIPEDEIKACYDEAERLKKLRGRDRDLAKVEKNDLWPVVKLVAPEDGFIVEVNVSRNEMVVDATTNLFQIAKVDQLLLLCNCPEDDLPTLQALKPHQMRWTVKTVGADAKEGLPGRISSISWLIDPNQHTGVVKGYIPNPGQRLRGGQFVSATIAIPPPEDVVEVPMDAVVEDGKDCIIFVQPDPKKHEYTMRRVQLTHRFDKTAFVRSKPFRKEDELTREEKELGMLPRQPLRVGERVLRAGVNELKAALLDMLDKAAQAEREANKAGKDK